MAIAFNKVILLGNLVRDPELRNTPTGVPVCKFRLAVNDPRRGGSSSDDQGREKTLFIDITTWRRTAEICAQYLSKGSSVLVEGRLDQDEWTDKESGQMRSKVYVTAFTVQFLPGRDKSPGGGGAGEDSQDAGSDYDSYSQDTPEPPARPPEGDPGGPSEERQALRDFGLDDEDPPF